jgi:RimJ/RimL family protein N-acetyltransferase
VHAAGMYELNADPRVIQYTLNPPFKDIQEAADFIANYGEYRKSGFGRWAVIKKETEEFIGWCGLKFNEEEMVDLGYRFHQREWGKGYATESARAVLEYGFDEYGLKEIVARAQVKNLASIRVMEKTGMEYWKTKKVKGEEDLVYYRINR